MPARLYSATVQAHWVDALDHVNFLEYQRAADQATGQFWNRIGGEPPSARSSLTLVIIETHAHYVRELRMGDRVDVDTNLVGYDGRRVHLHQSLLRNGELTCVVQVLGLAFDAEARRASYWPPHILTALATWRDAAEIARTHNVMSWLLGPDTRS